MFLFDREAALVSKSGVLSALATVLAGFTLIIVSMKIDAIEDDTTRRLYRLVMTKENIEAAYSCSSSEATA